jgi:hypothetical protein
MSNVEVVLAEQALEVARKKQRASQRTAQVSELRAVRKELVEKSKAYDALALKLSRAVDDKNDLEFEINHWREALNALEQGAPSAVRVRELSNDPLVISYHKEHAALTRKLEGLCAKRQQFFWIAATRVDAVQLAQQIAALQASERNLMRALTGELDGDHKDERGGTVRGVA